MLYMDGNENIYTPEENPNPQSGYIQTFDESIHTKITFITIYYSNFISFSFFGFTHLCSSFCFCFFLFSSFLLLLLLFMTLFNMWEASFPTIFVFLTRDILSYEKKGNHCHPIFLVLLFCVERASKQAFPSHVCVCVCVFVCMCVCF